MVDQNWASASDSGAFENSMQNDSGILHILYWNRGLFESHFMPRSNNAADAELSATIHDQPIKTAHETYNDRSRQTRMPECRIDFRNYLKTGIFNSTLEHLDKILRFASAANKCLNVFRVAHSALSSRTASELLDWA